DHPVPAGLAHLRTLWEQRWWLRPSVLLDRLLVERAAFVLAFGEGRAAEVWGRLRFLVDQARAFEEAGGGGLRAFLDWADLQRSDGAGVYEPLLPETGDDAVRIMTIHGAKGLEFPITIVSGMTTKPANRRKASASSGTTTEPRKCASGKTSAPPTTIPGPTSKPRWTSTRSSASSTSPAPGPATTWWWPSTTRPATAPTPTPCGRRPRLSPIRGGRFPRRMRTGRPPRPSRLWRRRASPPPVSRPRQGSLRRGPPPPVPWRRCPWTTTGKHGSQRGRRSSRRSAGRGSSRPPPSPGKPASTRPTRDL